MPKGVVNHHISYYSVALEGWRRGLKLTFHNHKRGGRIPSNAHQYTLSDGVTSHRFFCARSSYVSKESINIAEDKTKAYEYMRKNNVPIPKTETFVYIGNSIDSICERAEEIGFPLVVKPTNMGGGKGVFTNVKDYENLKKSILSIRDDFNSKRVIVERYFENAVDYRFYVMQNEVLAVSKSYSSNVIGNGINNIQALIQKRNTEIKNHISTTNRQMKINKDMRQFLKQQQLSLDSVPAKGERIFVREHGTYLGDRLNVDCTDEVDPKFKEHAVQALNSIPGLPCGSVDMIINEEKEEGIVNEVNSKGEIMMHVFPFEGKARDIPKAVIDYYFPNTKNNKRSDNFYFEFQPIKDMFLAGVADEIVVPKIPKEPEFIKKFILNGKYFGPRYLKQLSRKAASMHLIGSMSKEEESVIKIKTIGSKERIDTFESFIKKNQPRGSQPLNIESSSLEKFTGTSNINFEML